MEIHLLESLQLLCRRYRGVSIVVEIPQLREIAGKTWKKEDELKGLKTELAALDRKIQLELAPPQEIPKEETAQEIQKKNRDSNNRATLIHWNIFVSQKRGKGVPIVFYNDACIKAITKALRPSIYSLFRSDFT